MSCLVNQQEELLLAAGLVPPVSPEQHLTRQMTFDIFGRFAEETGSSAVQVAPLTGR